MKPIVISIVNHKGGVSKTTTTVNLAAALAELGKNVLVVDFDVQQDSTANLIGQKPDDYNGPTLYDAIMGNESLDHLIERTTTPRLDIIPNTEDFAGIELSLFTLQARELALKRCFKLTTRLTHYDYVLIDNSPSIGQAMINSLAASHYYLVPIRADFFSLKSLKLLSKSVQHIKRVLNEDLSPIGILITQYSNKEIIARETEKTLQKEVGDLLLKTKIKINTKVKGSPALAQTILQFENSYKGRSTVDYMSLARETLKIVGDVQQEGAVVNG